MDEATKEAIGYLEKVVKVSKNTAYDLVYNDIDIKCLEIVLDRIKELDRDNKDSDIVIVRQNQEIKELKKLLEE